MSTIFDKPSTTDEFDDEPGGDLDDLYSDEFDDEFEDSLREELIRAGLIDAD